MKTLCPCFHNGVAAMDAARVSRLSQITEYVEVGNSCFHTVGNVLAGFVEAGNSTEATA